MRNGWSSALRIFFSSSVCSICFFLTTCREASTFEFLNTMTMSILFLCWGSSWRSAVSFACVWRASPDQNCPRPMFWCVRNRLVLPVIQRIKSESHLEYSCRERAYHSPTLLATIVLIHESPSRISQIQLVCDTLAFSRAGRTKKYHLISTAVRQTFACSRLTLRGKGCCRLGFIQPRTGDQLAKRAWFSVRSPDLLIFLYQFHQLVRLYLEINAL